MNNGTPSAGQLLTLVSRIVSAMPRVIQSSEFDMKQVLRHTEGEGERLSLAILEALRMLCDGNAKLIPQPSTLAIYWRTRYGLYVHKTFVTRVLPFAKDDDVSNIDGCDFVVFQRNVYTSEIITKCMCREEETKKNAFTLNQVQAFIDAQWKGGAGPLLLNGQMNIFCVLGELGDLFLVNVFWSAGQWRVDGYGLDGDDRLYEGCHVFRNKH